MARPSLAFFAVVRYNMGSDWMERIDWLVW